MHRPGGSPPADPRRRASEPDLPVTGNPWMVIRRCTGTGNQGEVAECGCCGSRFSPRRIRTWLAAGEILHGEVCPECVLRGPRGAGRKLRERIREREERRTELRPGEAPRWWSEWMIGRARLLEAMEGFPLAARQAAVREMREKR